MNLRIQGRRIFVIINVIDYDFERVNLSIIKLHLCAFNRCSLIQLKINRLRKEINRLLGKGMSNTYIKVNIETFSKLLKEISNSCRNS